MAYCDRAHVYDWLPRGVVQRPARLIAFVSSSVLTLDDHGMASDDIVMFRAESGGALPSPIVAGTSYYVISLSDSTFRIAPTAGGDALSLTGTATNMLSIAPIPWDRWIEDESALIDTKCPAHVVPFTTVPVVVRRYVSAMVAQRAGIATGQATPALDAVIKDIRADLDGWLRGIAIRGTNAPTRAQVPTLYQGTSTESTRTLP